jgi:hypothetical protein
MGALPQILEIIFEVQRKTSDEKITKEKNFRTYTTRYFLFGPFLFSNLITLLFCIHLK